MGQAPIILFGAGATKAGTSWLWDYLFGHPDGHLRTIKELGFFGTNYPKGLHHRARKMEKEIAEFDAKLAEGKAEWPKWLVRQMMDRAEFREALLSDDPQAGYLSYLLAGVGDKKFVADMTPEYGLAPVERMRAMTALGNVRWIFLMRDPVDRMWSHVRMLVRRMKPAPDDFAAACMVKFDAVLAGEAEDVTLRSDYAAIHRRLTQAVPAGQLLSAFYEDVTAPDGVNRVTDFLGVARHPAKLEKRVHPGIPVDMPPALHQRARDWLRPQYDYVAREFGLPASWEALPELKV